MTRLALVVVLLAGAAVASSAGAALGASRPLPCPSTLPAAIASARPGAGQALVPAGPRSLLLCAYRGLNPAADARQLRRERVVRAGSALDWIVRTFDALPASSGISACPMDDGSAIVALFAYSAPPDDPVTVGLTGCRVVQNGRLTRTASRAPGPALLARLAALLG